MPAPTNNIAATSANGALLSAVLPTNPNDNECRVVLSGTYTGATGTLDVSMDNSTWINTECVIEPTSSPTNGTLSPSAANTSYWCRVAGWNYVRFNCTACASGSLIATVYAAPNLGGPPITVTTNSTTAFTSGTFSGTLAVTGNSTLTGSLACGALTVTGAVLVSTTLGVTGAATFSSTVATGALTVTGAATVSTTLGVTGAATFSSTVATGALTVTGAATVSTTLAVTGAVTMGSTLTITSASASAFKIGRLGATTPAFQIDASTATCITGLKVTAAGTGAGVALAAIGETNVALTIDSAGSGSLSLNSTGTGPVYLARGGLKAPIMGLTLTALGTAQNTTPTAAQLLGGVLTQTSATGAGTCTLPSGTTLANALALTQATGDSFDCWYTNLGGGQTVTITGATGTTVIGTAAIGSGKSCIMRFVNTGSNTWNIYVNASA